MGKKEDYLIRDNLGSYMIAVVQDQYSGYGSDAEILHSLEDYSSKNLSDYVSYSSRRDIRFFQIHCISKILQNAICYHIDWL